MVEGMGAADSALAARRDIRLYGASGLNVWNHLTVQYLANFQRLTLSPELSARQMAQLVARARLAASPALELVVQGNLEVVVAEDSLPLGQAGFWGLQDFRRIFPLRSDDEGRMHIFNSVETCLLDHLPRIFEIGLDGVAMDARGRTGKYSREMTEIYLKAIEATEKGSPSLDRDLQALKEEARTRSLGGITTGHFLKGLKEELS